MKVSVVVPTYNRRDKLHDCLVALLEQDYPDYEVIVVDDASTDGTPGMFVQEFAQVHYIRLDRNLGPAAARNRGIDVAQGEAIAFTDDDCRVPVDWLSRLVEGFDVHLSVSGVSGYQEAPDDLLETSVIARADRWRRVLTAGTRELTPQLGGYEVPGFGTNNVVYRKSVLQAVGGFDEVFPVAAGEDADLKMRIAQQGHTLLYIPLKVDHYRAYTLHAQWRMSVRRGIGAYYFEAKHSKAPTIFRIFLRVLKRTIVYLRNLCTVPMAEASVIYLSNIADCLGQFKTAVKLL